MPVRWPLPYTVNNMPPSQQSCSPHFLYVLCSYFVSAKTGDNVAATFYRIAADLAGVILTKPDIEVASKVVTAHIVHHPQDAVVASGEEHANKSSSKCNIM